MKDTPNQLRRLALRLAGWLHRLRRNRDDLSRLPDRIHKDIGLDSHRPDPRTIRSQHDAMRFSG